MAATTLAGWSETLAEIDAEAFDDADYGDDDGEADCKPEPQDLQRFLEGEVMPWYRHRRGELGNRHLIQTQAFGEAMDPHRLERLARYEVHLDRKLERILGMLLKLQDLRHHAGSDGLIRFAKNRYAEKLPIWSSMPGC